MPLQLQQAVDTEVKKPSEACHIREIEQNSDEMSVQQVANYARSGKSDRKIRVDRRNNPGKKVSYIQVQNNIVTFKL